MVCFVGCLYIRGSPNAGLTPHAGAPVVSYIRTATAAWTERLCQKVRIQQITPIDGGDPNVSPMLPVPVKMKVCHPFHLPFPEVFRWELKAPKSAHFQRLLR